MDDIPKANNLYPLHLSIEIAR